MWPSIGQDGAAFGGLAVDVELRAAVLLPAGLVLFGAELTLLAVADDADAAGVDAGSDEGLLGGVGAVFAEGDVVLGGAAVVAVAGDEHLDVLVRIQIGGGGGDGGLVGGTDVVAVVVEEEILDCGVEGGVGAGVGCGLRCRGDGGDADGYADVGFGGAAVTFGDEMEVGGAGRRDGLCAVDCDVADAVDGDGVALVVRQLSTTD